MHILPPLSCGEGVLSKSAHGPRGGLHSGLGPLSFPGTYMLRWVLVWIFLHWWQECHSQTASFTIQRLRPAFSSCQGACA